MSKHADTLHPETIKYLNPESYQNIHAKQIIRVQKVSSIDKDPEVVKHIKNPSLVKASHLNAHQVDSYQLAKKPRSLSPKKYNSPYSVGSHNPVKHLEPLDNVIKLPPIHKYSNSSRNSPYRIHNEGNLGGITTRKALTAEDIRKFEQKYDICFCEGYTNKIIETCTDLLNKEDDPVILENIFPGKYKEYITNASRPHHQGIVKSINKSSYQLLKNSISQDLKASLFPPIRVFPQSTKSANGHTPSDRQDSVFNLASNEDTAFSGFAITSGQNLPKVSIESFKTTLTMPNNSFGRSTLIQLAARNKSVPIDFGFCEIVFEDGKVNSGGYITKFFICKIYRKMKIVELIILQLLDYLFKRYDLERIRIDLIKSHDSIHKDMKRVGFKLQKVDNVNIKYKTYLLKRADFNSLMISIVQAEQLNLGRK